jgi:hypothetical protein
MVERNGEGQDAIGRQARATMRRALERMLRLEAGRGEHQAPPRTELGKCETVE